MDESVEVWRLFTLPDGGSSLEALPRRLGRAEGPPTTPGQIDSHNAFVQLIPSVATREVVLVG